MISRTTQYALQVLGRLGRVSAGRVRGEELARSTGIPANYLSKILSQLGKHGFVDAEKGWGGGFSLREDARSRPIAEVLMIMEGTGGLGDDGCGFRVSGCTAEDPCPLHRYWERLRATYLEMLRLTTVGDLAGTNRTVRRGRPGIGVSMESSVAGGRRRRTATPDGLERDERCPPR